MSLPVVVQHSWGDPGSGGPIGALERVLNSPLSEKYDFVRMHQETATGGIDHRRIREWRAFLRDAKPDIVHVRGLGNEGFHGVLAARLAGCERILVSMHGSVRDLAGPATPKQRIIAGVLEPATLAWASHVTTVCEFAAARPFVARHYAKLVGPMINGVELRDLPAPSIRQAVRGELGLRDDDIAVISVGRLARDKGHADLAAAFRSMDVQALRRLVFVVVGDGPDRDEIAHGYEIPGLRVRELGRRHDVLDLLAGADLFVFPSWHENLSNALLEAMAASLPVVATSVGGNTEVLRRGGGVLVQPHAPDQLAQAMHALIFDHDRRGALGTQARAVAAESYSMTAMLERLDSIYTTMLGEVHR